MTTKRKSQIYSILKKQGIIFACALILTGLLWTISWISSTTVSCSPVAPENSVSIYNPDNITTMNCTLEDNIVYRQGDDPGIIISNIEGTTRTFTLVMSSPLYVETLCTLYYPDENGAYSEQDSDSFIASTDTDTLVFEIPARKYSELRLDVNYSYQIQDILVSPDEPVTSYNMQSNLTAGIFILVFFIMLIIMEALVYIIPTRMLLKRLISKKLPTRAILFTLVPTVVMTVVIRILLNLIDIPFGGVRLFVTSGIIFITLHTIYRYVFENKNFVSLPEISIWKCSALIFCAVILFLFAIFFASEIITNGKSAYLGVGYLVFSLFLICLSSYLYYKYMLSYEAFDICNIYTFIIAAAGIMYLILFLPMVVPDEFTHFTTAYRFSNIFCLKFSQFNDTFVLMRQEDAALYSQYHKYLSYDYYTFVLENLRLFVNDSTPCLIPGSTGSNALFGYVFSGLGITLARVLHFSGILTYYTGRFFNLLLFLLSIRFAFKRLPFGKTAVFVFAIFPMVLHEVCSYSYDGPIISFALLFITQTLYMAFSDRPVTRRDVILCAVFAALLAPSKMVYSPILLLIFIIPKERLNCSLKKAIYLKSGIVLCGLVSMILTIGVVSILDKNYAVTSITSSVHFVSAFEGIGYSPSWILSHLNKAIALFIRTLTQLWDNYFFTMIGASLGWLDIPVPKVICLLFVVAFIFACMEKSNAMHTTYENAVLIRLLCILIIAATVGLSMLVLMLAWTPVDATIISGVQGRYFLPAFILMILVLQNKHVSVLADFNKQIVLLCGSLQLYIILSIFSTALYS